MAWHPTDQTPQDPELSVLHSVLRARLFSDHCGPAKIGRFTVVSQLGAGGMGVVWLAHDEDLDRRVAVKLLRRDVAGEDAERAAVRLRREAQAMAKLHHPNVVAVHEVGRHQDSIFLAMEYVQGETLAAWLAARPRRWRECIAQLVLAGRGLQAAHEGGLVHRDFKPDNVLVGVDGRVCVTDFGLARADRDSATLTSSTSLEHEALGVTHSLFGDAAGTPTYMAHECLTGGEVTPASDQFSFCVTLYQALWQRHPFGTTTKAAVQAVIAGQLPVPPPNGPTPARIWRLVRQGLSHDPAARHASLRRLLDALADDPARRWRQRAMFAAVVVGVSLTAAYASRDSPCEDLDASLRQSWNEARKTTVGEGFAATGLAWAPSAWQRDAEQLDQWATRWADQAQLACRATHVQGTQSVERLDARMECLERQRRSLNALLDVLHTDDPSVLERAHEAVASLPDPETCADLDALGRLVPRPTDPVQRAQLEAAEDQLARGWALYETGQFSGARQAADAALAVAEKVAYRPTEGLAARLLGDALEELGEGDAAQEALRRALAAAMGGRDDTTVARVWLSLAYVELFRRSDPQAAARHADLAAAAAEALGNTRPFRIDLLRLRGQIALAAGDIKAGRQASEEALALLEASDQDGTRVAAGELSLGTALHAVGEFDASAEHLAAAVEIFTSSLGGEHPYTLRARNNFAYVLTALRRLDEAAAEHQAVLELRERVLGPTHPEVAGSLTGLAGVLHHRDDTAGALALQQRALAIFDTALGPDHESSLAAAQNVAHLMALLGQHEAALAMAQRVVDALVRKHGPDHPDLAGAQQQVARALRGLGRPREARAQLDHAIELAERTLGADHPSLVSLRVDRGETLTMLGERFLARIDLEHGLALAEQRFGPDSGRLITGLRALAVIAEPTEAAALRARADRIESE